MLTSYHNLRPRKYVRYFDDEFEIDDENDYIQEEKKK